MDDLIPAFLTALAAYLIGGIPFGYLIARSRGIDIFKTGSGNIGATNVGRVLGRKYGILAFVLDFAKGALPVVVARALAPQIAANLRGEELGVLAGLCAVLGHLFPPYLRFRGGKGVATAAGVVVVLLPLAALAALLVWIGVVAATRYVSAGSLAAAVALCAVRLLTVAEPLARGKIVLTAFCFVAAALVFVRHRANIGRLLDGTENRLKESHTMQRFTKIVHVLAVGLWFGSTVFFSFVVGLNLFGAMDELVVHRAAYSWFELPANYQRPHEPTDRIDWPKEYGSRLAGFLISPMFGWYFLIQGICGFLAVATAWTWRNRQPHRTQRARIIILLVALATVGLGWPLEQKVSELRHNRHQAMDAVLLHISPDTEAAEQAALDAKAAFGLFHMYSLFLNFITIGLVATGMSLAAFLPPTEEATNGTRPAKDANGGNEIG